MNKLRAANFLILILLTSFYSCTDDADDPSADKLVNITIDDKVYKPLNENIGGNENCDNLYVYVSHTDNTTIDFTINFSVSKTGELLEVMYGEYTAPLNVSQTKKMFLTPNFNPLSSFTISDFFYDETSGNVKFAFNGTVYYERDNKIVREISGAVVLKSIPSIVCGTSKTGLTYYSEPLKLFATFHNSIKYSNQNQVHGFFQTMAMQFTSIYLTIYGNIL